MSRSGRPISAAEAEVDGALRRAEDLSARWQRVKGGHGMTVEWTDA